MFRTPSTIQSVILITGNIIGYLVCFALAIVIFYDSKKRLGKPHFLWTVGGLVFMIIGFMIGQTLIREILDGLMGDTISSAFTGKNYILRGILDMLFAIILANIGFRLYKGFTPKRNAS